jgi:Peptidase family M28
LSFLRHLSFGICLELTLLLVSLSVTGLVRGEDPPAKSPQLAASPERIAPEAIRRHVSYLASPLLEGRGTTRGKQLAGEYIRRRFEELRLRPLFGAGGYYQEIPGAKTDAEGPAILGRNIGAFLPGSDPKLKDEFVIVSAHYDHLGIRGGKIYPGADDNAGSVAMMLEVARRFAESKVKPARTVVFLSCDLEENLLWGARWFVAHPPWPLSQVKLFVTAEMIGRTLGDLPLGTVFVLGSEHATGLKQIVDGVKTPAELSVAHLGIDLIGTRSDYGPFWNEKVPFLFFSGGEHPDYHQPTDTADRLDYVRVAQVSQLILDVCRQVVEVPETPLWNDEPIHDLDEVRTLHRITKLLLVRDDAARARGAGKLSNLQRFTVSNVHTRTAQMIDRGEVRPDERPWLIRSSQILLLAVF